MSPLAFAVEDKAAGTKDGRREKKKKRPPSRLSFARPNRILLFGFFGGFWRFDRRRATHRTRPTDRSIDRHGWSQEDESPAAAAASGGGRGGDGGGAADGSGQDQRRESAAAARSGVHSFPGSQAAQRSGDAAQDPSGAAGIERLADGVRGAESSAPDLDIPAGFAAAVAGQCDDPGLEGCQESEEWAVQDGDYGLLGSVQGVSRPNAGNARSSAAAALVESIPGQEIRVRGSRKGPRRNDDLDLARPPHAQAPTLHNAQKPPRPRKGGHLHLQERRKARRRRHQRLRRRNPNADRRCSDHRPAPRGPRVCSQARRGAALCIPAAAGLEPEPVRDEQQQQRFRRPAAKPKVVGAVLFQHPDPGDGAADPSRQQHQVIARRLV